jgi:hypothetical protein
LEAVYQAFVLRSKGQFIIDKAGGVSPALLQVGGLLRLAELTKRLFFRSMQMHLYTGKTVEKASIKGVGCQGFCLFILITHH